MANSATLITSLNRVKLSAGGKPLPMMAVPAGSLTLIDPTFTIGYGALTEDPIKGLRCPVRNCGRYFHNLGSHLRHHHKDQGGVGAVRRALSLPVTASLVSERERTRLRTRALEIYRNRPGVAERVRMGSIRGIARLKILGPRYRTSGATIGSKNAIERCEAQVLEAIRNLADKLGHSPTADEARAEYGSAFVYHAEEWFGSWNGAKERAGLETYGGLKDPVGEASVLGGIRLWHEMHGALPSSKDARREDRFPRIPHRDTVLRTLGTRSWPEAMRRAAERLQLPHGSYALVKTQ